MCRASEPLLTRFVSKLIGFTRGAGTTVTWGFASNILPKYFGTHSKASTCAAETVSVAGNAAPRSRSLLRVLSTIRQNLINDCKKSYTVDMARFPNQPTLRFAPALAARQTTSIPHPPSALRLRLAASRFPAIAACCVPDTPLPSRAIAQCYRARW